MAIPAAYPFISVKVVPPPAPAIQRAPGVIAVVGKTPAGAPGGAAAVNKPVVIDTLDDAVLQFARRLPNGNVDRNDLYNSLEIALLQEPKPSKVYGVRVQGDDYAAALGSLEAADDVTFVSLANVSAVGVAAAGANPATLLMALKSHVENMSAEGQRRIGFAMVDPAAPKTATYVDDTKNAVAPLKSDSSRMVVIAARGATTDAATAAMSAVAGLEPSVSIVLKKIQGVTMPVEKQYSPSEIKGLSEANIVPIIDPAMIAGESLHFADGRTFTTSDDLLYIDFVRTLDDLEFRLRAGLINLIGDARITKYGMTLLKSQTDGILGVQKRNQVIDDYDISIPVLDILNTPQAMWTATEQNIVTTARGNRTVDMTVTVWYGPAVSRLLITLAAKF